MAVADTDVNIFDDTENSGNGGGGGGGTEVTIYSSRNTLETEEVSPGRWDLNVKSETGRNFYVRNFHEFMDAIQTIANLYISGDTVGNVIQLLGNIDMTAPTVDDEENYVLSNGDNLIDIPNKTYNLRQYLRYTKIVSYGSKRALQLLHPNSSRTAYDTWQLNVIRFTAENLSIGGDIAAWIGEFGHGDVGRDLPCEYQRYMFSSPGNILYDIKDCYITCCGANQTISNSFNPFLSMGSTLNAGLWVSSLNMTNCMFIAGRSLTTTDPNLNAPIVINCNWYESRSKTVVLKQMSKQVNDTEFETGVPNIQIRTDNTSSATTAWSSNKWEVTTDGTALIFCVLDDCMVFAPKLALNDLYLEGTPLTPPSATPTEDKVSLVSELLKRLVLKITNMGANDALTDSDQIYFQGAANTATDANVKRGTLSKLIDYVKGKLNLSGTKDDFDTVKIAAPVVGGAYLHVIADVTRVYNGSDTTNIYGFQGVVFPVRDGSSATRNTITRIVATVSYSDAYVYLSTDCLLDGNYIEPCVIKKDDKWLLCIKDSGNQGYYGATRMVIFGRFYKTNQPFDSIRTDTTFEHYYNTETEIEYVKRASRYPMYASFGGSVTNVVRGDGSLVTLSNTPTLNSSAPITSGGVYTGMQDKLGYWKGETANLPPVGSRDANKLYVTTDY